MSWKAELVRAFFVAFGAGQTLANLTYLICKNGMYYARKQHRELPVNVSEQQVRGKAASMFFFGLLILFTGLAAYVSRSYHERSFAVVMGLFALYELIEALYYRYWRTTGAFILSAVLFIVLMLT